MEATGDLSMQAGRDIGIIGSDVKAGGDATFSAGRDVIIAAQELESHNFGKTGKSKSTFNTQTSKAATVEAGGSVSISAGQDVAVHGSSVSAGADVNIEAGRDVSITSATDGYDYHFKQKSKGGFFGGSSSEMHTGKVTTNVASAITAGGDVHVAAGQGGAGDLAVVGSKVRSGGDMSLKAEDGILVSSAQESESMISASSRSTLFSGKSKASGDAHVTQVGSEIVAGNDLKAEAKNVAVSASQIHAGHDVDIKSAESDLIVSGAQNTVSGYRYEKKSGWNLSAPLEIPLAILVGGGVEFYSSKMKEGKNTASSNFGSLITAGNNIDLESARDAVMIGSSVAAGNDVNISAVRDSNIIPGLTAQISERRIKEKSIGFSSLSISENEIKGFAGVTKTESGSKFTGDYNAGSVVSAGNDVSIEAGNNVNQFSSGIEAGRDVKLKSGNDVNIDADQDVEHMENYAREIQIGVTASARQSVTTAARTLADTPGNMAAGEGSDAAKGITAASAILRGVSAAQQLTNVGASASITAGASVSQSRSFMDAADAVASSIRAGRDAELDADRDVRVSGAMVLAEEDIAIQAGRDVEIKSATNTYSVGADSFFASAGVGVGASYSARGGAAAGIRVQAEAAGSENTSRAQTHANSVVAAGETLSVKSGADTTLAGANLEGRKVAMDVGGDLLVKSEQDKRAAAGSNWNAGGSVTFGYGFSADAHLGMGKSSADSAWVNRQTSVIGQEEVDIRTEKNTHVEGAVIAAKNGNLKLDTGTLTYGDIKDKDTSKGFQANLSGSYSSGGDNTGPTFDGSYGSSDRRQVNRATIGEGEIIIRSDPATGLEGLNRNLRRAQEITRDEQTSVVVYFDSAAIQEIASGFAGIRGNLETLGELVKQALPDDQRLQDSVDNQLSIRGKLIEKGMTDEQADAMLQKYALYADLMGEIGKLVDAKGGWSNLTETEAQAFVDSLQRDSRFVTLLASSDNIVSDSQAITINSGKYLVGTVTGGLQTAGSDTKSVLLFLNDMSGYMLYSASGGLLFQENAINFTNTVHDFTDAVVYLSQHIDEVGPAVVEGLEKKWNDYLLAVGDGDYYRAGNLYGEFYYEVGTVLVTAIGTAKSLMSGLKSAAPKFAATVEAAEAARVAKVGDKVFGVAVKSVLEEANYAQKTIGNMFSKAGKFAGQSVDDVAAALRAGKLNPSEVPIDYIVRDGNALILNTRSAQALTNAGIPRSQWNAINRTGQAAYEARLTGQLTRNNLTSKGISTVRQTGGR
ncbi:hemagglutinin repeat-containing protein [Desulfomicrobium norvegicum]|uniref:hemagglutinin repeat-containing protein n=1 Tax=Desulfomicrobium norvegicum (strain DSM 1741 / NCIMB 8310) TaxID=52561 RepID=UPI0024483CA4|nr:hemagglutinin repeat-containing protein [Desulfomicrobium norvegicum]